MNSNMTEARPVYLPELLHTEPTLEIFIEVSPVLLVKTSVAEICTQLIHHLSEMAIGDFERIEHLYRQMICVRDEQVRELPLFQALETVS